MNIFPGFMQPVHTMGYAVMGPGWGAPGSPGGMNGGMNGGCLSNVVRNGPAMRAGGLAGGIMRHGQGMGGGSRMSGGNGGGGVLPAARQLFGVYVGNMSYGTNEATLTKAFVDKGLYPISTRVLVDMDGNHRGFGFVNFATNVEMNTAIQTLDGEWGIEWSV